MSGGREARSVLAGSAGVADDLDDVRECLSRLAFAFTGLLGNRPDPAVAAARLRELAGISREIGDLCDQRAVRLCETDIEGQER